MCISNPCTEAALTPLTTAGGTLATSETLQTFSRARLLRLGLQALFGSTTALSPFGEPVPTLPFYQISDVQVGCVNFNYYLTPAPHFLFS